MTPLWFHIDMDAFFAAVEQRDNPSLRGLPVIVGAPPGVRGVVSTCSYEARAFGVRSAMPSSQAARLCPQAIFIRPRMRRYHEVSTAIMRIFADYTPRLIQVSVDEAFLEMTGTERLLGPSQTIAQTIKNRVRDELGLTLSVGAASNKLIAKIASGWQKPDGLTLVESGSEAAFMLQVPLGKIWGLGTKTQETLGRFGIGTVAQLIEQPIETLIGRFGRSAGTFLWQVARGQDPGLYEGESKDHSLSSETTFDVDIAAIDTLDEQLFFLTHGLVFRLIEEGAVSSTIALKIRTENFETFTVQKTLPRPITTIEETFDLAKQLLRKRWDGVTPLRLIGLGFHNLGAENSAQGDLFEAPNERRQSVEKAAVNLEGKFGRGILSKARTLPKGPPPRRPNRDTDSSQ